MMGKIKETIKLIPGAVNIARKIRGSPALIRKYISLRSKRKDALKQLQDWDKNDSKNPKSLPLQNRKHWQHKLNNMVIDLINSSDSDGFSKAMCTIEAFYESQIECLRPFHESPSAEDVILVTAVRNNASRIEHFLHHYRNIGVKHFAFIDNGSTDNTLDMVMKQQDTACFKTLTAFNSERKTAWFNRVAAHYDPNMWFILVDSDELLAYPEMTQLSIQEYTKVLQQKGIDFVKTFMVDVYPNGPLMDDSMTDEEYLEACIYFDKAESYAYAKNKGALRSRLFVEKKAEKPNLNKPALLRLANYFLLSSHYIFPKFANNVPHGAVVLHYKFLPSDRKNYIDIVKDGAYHENDLKIYDTINKKIETQQYINPMCELSVPFDFNEAWQHLPFVANYTQIKNEGTK
ncbi:MAG: glycosyltransferase family 2 protein [Turicibacter sp.]|nr:glycosyltransferase family 2 protein [Turicibacter sp.]